MDAAVQLRLEMTRALHDRTWAIPALIELGRAWILRGLVSDYSAETPAIWSGSPLAAQFETVSFSCITGHRKPEPEAYLIAVNALGIGPQECLYVGGGGSHELTGAERLGMQAIRFEPPMDGRGDAIDEDPDWTRDAINDLADLVAQLT